MEQDHSISDGHPLHGQSYTETRSSMVPNGRSAECGEVWRIPAASQRLDQKHTRVQPPPQDIDVVSLVGELDRLRGDDLDATACRCCCASFSRNAQGGDIVFHFLERCQW